ncbi:peptidase domain-containing ABC transporter [Pandoraea sp. PE-S2T-3]|uniref:peptidase domain-containing ABC transporter n=1 Tax=Pandoraea sp. PE-S2T-3 TaxID=1986993 RepID=UPI000B3FCCBB|nr:peptidase domain-containing ABC transporter [Pandoraea sp. PE-S2T-3]
MLDKRQAGNALGCRTPSVLQTEAAECGLACLAMIAGFYGHQIDLPSLRARFPISQMGVTLANLVSISRRMNLVSRPVSLDLDALGKLKLPCILHWNFNHFVVLVRVGSRGLSIHDPAQGPRTVTLSEASRAFTGVALELWPHEAFVARNERRHKRVTDLLGTVSGLIPAMAQVFALALSLEIFVLVSPFYLQWVIDHALVSGDRDLLLTLLIGFSLLLVCQHGVAALRSWALMRLGATWNLQWRANLFSHLVRLPVQYFIRRHLGDVLSRFGAVDEIQRTLTTSFIEGVLDGGMALLTLALMFVYSPPLAAVALGFMALYAVLRLGLFRALRGATEAHLVHASRQQSHFLETLRGIKTIKLFSREDDRSSTWLTLLVRQINADLRIQRLTMIHKHANGFLMGVENILIIWLGATFVIEGRFTAGALIALLAYKLQFQTRMSSLIDKLAEYRMLGLQAARLADIALSAPESPATGFSAPPSAPPSAPTPAFTSETPPGCDAALEVTRLSFRYSEYERLILEDVTFSIRAGESVAIVGPSGCGKSTLAHLLLGILTPTSGVIQLSGKPVGALGVGRLRQAVGTVMQDDTLLAGSLADNVSFFDTQADAAWIRECARLACIDQEIEAMPMGYNTLVGDMGTVLSGGQKQRILLARALYKRPRMLLLDEATSHLDAANERQVNEAVRSLHMTRLIIAHRAETIATADRVITLHGGRIVSDRPQSDRPADVAAVAPQS